MEKIFKIEDLGYSDFFENSRIENKFEDFEIGRVITQHKDRYIVKTADGDFEAKTTGNLKFSAKNSEDLPAVGDWVVLKYDHFAVIHSILPRFSIISRQAVGKFGEKQVIAANIDYAFLVQAIDRDFNINRLERYLAICYSSKITPIIVLTKIDLIEKEELKNIIEDINKRINNILIITISSETKEGYQSLKNIIKKGKTYCLLGSSGVGKSTMINNLLEKKRMKTNSISKKTNKGKHITSHRELIVLETGGIVIDNPGMREIGITDSSESLETTFDNIMELSQQCKFTNCTHISETGCAVIDALNNGKIDDKTYRNFLKIEKEKDFFEMTLFEKRKKDKSFGKIVKNLKKIDPKRWD